MTIYFIEYEEDFNQFITKIFPFEKGKYFVCALSATAAHLLESRNIHYISIEKYTSFKDRRMIGQENFEICEWLCDYLDNLLNQGVAFSIPFKTGIFPLFKWHIVRVKILLDVISTSFARVQRIIEALQPNRVVISGRMKKNIDPYFLGNSFFAKDESLYSVIIRSVSENSKYKIEYWDVEKEPPKKSTKHSLRKIVQVFKNKIVRERIYPIYTYIKHKFSKGRFLLFSRSYDFDVMIKNFPSILLSSEMLKSVRIGEMSEKAEDFFRHLLCDENISKRLSFEGHSYAPVFIEKIKELFYFNLEKVAEEVHQFVKNYKEAKAAIFPAGPQNFIQSMIFETLGEHHVKIFVLQHGGYGYARNNIVDYSDFNYNGCFLAWGTGIAEMYEKTQKGIVTIVPVGSPKIKNIRMSSEKTVVNNPPRVYFLPHAPNGYIYYWNSTPMQDIEFFHFQKDLFRVMLKYKDKYKLIIKLHPSVLKSEVAYFDYHHLYAEELKHIIIETRALDSIISDADLFVMDFPTTIFIQALATGKPIISMNYKDHYYIDKKEQDLLPENVILCEDYYTFFNAVDNTLSHEDLRFNYDDHRFLEKYGIHQRNPEENIVNAVNVLTS